jgi:dihydroflavonol-4-reductase
LLLDKFQNSTLSGLPIQSFYGNVLDSESLTEAFAGQDYVVHCAAATSVFPARNEQVNKVNIEGSKNVAEMCIKHNIKRLIYIGTANSFSYGTTKENPGIEDSPYISIKYGLDYMDSKRYAQEYILETVKSKGLPAIVVNPTFMIGPYDSKPSSGLMILAMHKGKVPGFSKGGKNYIAVKDVVVAIVNALKTGRIGECYILGNENLTYKEAFEKFAYAIGKKAPKRKLSDFAVKTYGAVNSSLAKIFKYDPILTKELAIISCENHFYSAEKAKKELNLPQTPIEVAVKECYEWFRENGYL